MANHHPPAEPARSRIAFTLIELLIVVTIIAILAAIAVPNFLDAQIRAKVGRTKADMRSLATAIESYRVDNNNYPYRRSLIAIPPSFTPATAEVTHRAEQMDALTTPISYISTLPPDIFDTRTDIPNNIIEYYDPFQASWLLNATHPIPSQLSRRVPEGGKGFLLFSVGPDTMLGAVDNSCACFLGTIFDRGTIYYNYDPTNGTVSNGNIYYGSFYGMDGGSALTRQFYAGTL